MNDNTLPQQHIWGQTNLPSEKSDLLEKIKPDMIVTEIKHKLMGEYFDQKIGEWVKNKVLADRSISEIGAEEIATLILSVCSQNTSLGNLKDDEIRKIALGTQYSAIESMINNWEEYGIKNRSQIEYISRIVLNLTFITLKQSQNEGIRSLLKGTTQEVKTINEGGQKQGGIISRLWR